MRPPAATRHRLPAAALLGLGLLGGLAQPAAAQAVPPAAPPQAAPPAASAAAPAAPIDPVVARVGGQDIHLSDLSSLAQNLPEQLRGMPPQTLYPMLLEQLIDRQAMALYARKQGLDHDPAVEHAIHQAVDQTLTNALLQRDVGPSLTEPAIKAVYERDYANKPGEMEVHARHILVATEAEADKVIAQLKAGSDFETLAKQVSTEPGAKQSGGDLGWFKKGDMVPEFAAAAFAMKPGQFSQTPVHTQFGWHVIQVLEVRQAPPQTLEQVHDQIRQQLIQQGVQKVQQQAMAGLAVERFNPDGSPQRATDSAEPPPAAPKP
jgi:peptidyl-prolyl cis-trans isomerase C